MPIAQTFLAEFEEQAPVTRRFLERLPEDKLTWKPHGRSRSAGQLALHLAEVPGTVVCFVQEKTAQAPDFSNLPEPANREEVLRAFDESVATVRSLLPKLDDAAMKQNFRVLAGEVEVLAMPRLLDVPVPASWGPSADEAPAMARKPAGVTA